MIPAMPPVTLKITDFGEELKKHVRPAGADRHAQTDFPGSLGHRYQKNVHDADPADDERYRCDGGEQERHDAAAAFGGFRDLAELRTVKSLTVAGPDPVSAYQYVGHLADRRLNCAGRGGLHVDLVDVAGQPLLKIVGIGRRQDRPS